MKLHIIILTFCYLLLTSVSVIAEDAENHASSSASIDYTSKEARILHRLLQMEDHELAELRQTIERIEKMSQTERTRLRERIHRIHRMPPHKIKAMRERFEAIPREQREAMQARLMEMNPEERAEWRRKLKEMTPAERQNTLKQEEFLPKKPRKSPPLAKETDEIPVENSFDKDN